MNLLKLAALGLPIIGGAIGLAADICSEADRTNEAREIAREAAVEEVQRIFAENTQSEEEA